MSSRKVSAPTAAEKRLAAERAAAARARIATAQRRRRMLLVGGAVTAVLAVIAAFVVVKVAVGGKEPKSGQKAHTAASSLITDLSSVPAATFDAVGLGSADTGPGAITAPRWRPAASRGSSTSAPSTARTVPRSAGRWRSR